MKLCSEHRVCDLYTQTVTCPVNQSFEHLNSPQNRMVKRLLLYRLEWGWENLIF